MLAMYRSKWLAEDTLVGTLVRGEGPHSKDAPGNCSPWGRDGIPLLDGIDRRTKTSKLLDEVGVGYPPNRLPRRKVLHRSTIHRDGGALKMLNRIAAHCDDLASVPFMKEEGRGITRI